MEFIPKDIILEILKWVNPYYIFKDVMYISKYYYNIIENKINIDGCKVSEVRYLQSKMLEPIAKLTHILSNTEYSKFYNWKYPEVELDLTDGYNKNYNMCIMERILQTHDNDYIKNKCSERILSYMDLLLKYGKIGYGFHKSSANSFAGYLLYSKDYILQDGFIYIINSNPDNYIQESSINTYFSINNIHNPIDLIMHSDDPNILVKKLSLINWKYDGNVTDKILKYVEKINLCLARLEMMEHNDNMTRNKADKILHKIRRLILKYIYHKDKNFNTLQSIMRKYIELKNRLEKGTNKMFDEKVDPFNTFIVNTLNKEIIQLYFRNVLEIEMKSDNIGVNLGPEFINMTYIGKLNKIINKNTLIGIHPEKLHIVIPWINEVLLLSCKYNIYDLMMYDNGLLYNHYDMYWILTYAILSKNKKILRIVLDRVEEFNFSNIKIG
ncbi:Hypothetical protein ORPV_418 [Orpheovirus IHUMI-LCC2]|uniref:Uncharacterized protein n=1 Tax=Orpheovirus IHUMI-LCC2 TaxID=2023057 RepID=A0A2I2L451_9VIRU|nr:Hypothetical protein ORPV_418 [Orpheovirus IHUMI-LCC2]SNW62322.1 Hypothetical protein ORPV_418 [Orpheovirus IHUMI-LCC2]